jgi:predicted dehydrogenase
VYAPPVAKLRRLLEASGGAILELRAEESHSGSHAAYARRWRSAGGGSLLRMGSHPDRRRAAAQALGGHPAHRAVRSARARSSPRWRASRGFRRWQGSSVTCRPLPRTSRTGRSR